MHTTQNQLRDLYHGPGHFAQIVLRQIQGNMRNYLRMPLLKLTGPLLLSMLLVKTVSAQQVQPLSLRAAIDTVLAQNMDLLIAQSDQTIALSRAKEANAVFLPQVQLSFTALSSNNPLNAFGSKLQQQRVTAADFNPALLNSPGSVPDFNTRLELLQPIVNYDQWYQRKAATAQTELQEQKIKRLREYLSYETTRAYLQLQLADEAVIVLEETLQSAQALARFTSDRFEQGLLQKSDLLQAQVWIRTVESNLAEAKSNVSNASDYLSMLMGQPTGTRYATVDSVSNSYTLTELQVPRHRADFAAMDKAIQGTDWMIRSQKAAWLPRLNGFASYQLNDQRLLGFNARSYLAGLQLSWSVFSGNNIRNKINTRLEERRKLSLQLNQLQSQSQLELNKTVRTLADAGFRVDQQKASVLQAAEALRIIQDRYEQGLVNSTEVLLSQSQLSQQKLALAQANFLQKATASYYQFLITTSN